MNGKVTIVTALYGLNIKYKLNSYFDRFGRVLRTIEHAYHMEKNYPQVLFFGDNVSWEEVNTFYKQNGQELP